ncbi:MAG: hypothetical protein NT092_03250 [Bacteroidia bacterium]|nr:hypothetical protein [Bacteroidia bacterium]
MIKILAFSIWLVFHPVHVTLTSIDHVRGTDSLKVFVRMYYDDFLLDYKLFDSLNDSAKNLSPDQLLKTGLMNKYISEKVNIIVNNKELNGKLLKLDMTDNEISMDLLYSTAKKPKTITVRNLIMTDLYTDQANMTIVRVNNFEEGVKLTTGKPEQTFNLKRKQKREIEK